MRIRTSRTTGCPRAWRERRIWRLRPSARVSVKVVVALAASKWGRPTRAGEVTTPSSRRTPETSRRTSSAPSVPRAFTRYTRGLSREGWSSAWVTSPSLVSSSRPSLSRSRRPTGKIRTRRSGTRSSTLRRPRSSRTVVTTPLGLFRIQ